MITTSKITVELGGKARVVKFGLGATKTVCDWHKITLTQMAERFGLDDLFVEEIYGGMVHALALENELPDFNRAQVFDWIDAMPQAEMQRVFDCWLMVSQHGETRYEKFIKVLEANNNGGENPEKKNLIGKTSSK